MKKDFEYCIEYYENLSKHSKPREINDIPCTVFEGSLVDIFRGMGVSQGYYSKVRDILESLGCITILKRGSRAGPSLVILHHPPDFDEYLLLNRPLTGSLDGGKLAFAVRESLKQLLGGMDIVDTLDSIDKRITTLEQLTTGGSSGKTQNKQTGEEQ
jgi:hypothetical protein